MKKLFWLGVIIALVYWFKGFIVKGAVFLWNYCGAEVLSWAGTSLGNLLGSCFAGLGNFLEGIWSSIATAFDSIKSLIPWDKFQAGVASVVSLANPLFYLNPWFGVLVTTLVVTVCIVIFIRLTRYVVSLFLFGGG